MSAILWVIASWRPTGLPHCTRSLLQRRQICSASLAAPTEPLGIERRPSLRVVSAILSPCPSLPMRLPAGIRTAVKLMTALASAFKPMKRQRYSTLTPAIAVSTTKALIFLVLGSRAITTNSFASVPLVHQSLRPLRIPERIVHARGSAAHGYFECYEAQTELTRASFLAEKGKRTPVFVRFSTVAGERGSTDTPRDVRGFATKFYTDEGNFDIVGNNTPVFFIQDAMQFADLVHAPKPEPHHAMPQAASAHDTFWDFVSLMPESTHMLMWVMSDRALPRSFRTMQGFGVHTFRLVNAAGESRFVKFHWEPLAGTHSLDWDECVKIARADPDFTRRDLWESIEAGGFPEYELRLQVFTEEQAEAFSFEVLAATKIGPEELVPLIPVGRMVLDRNPDNFFAETEQVAFGVQNLVPGIDFSNDPLLAGRIHSYFDTQLSRLGGPTFHAIPINSSVAQPHNNQRDGLHRQAIHRGRVSYEPNSLAGGCPFQAGAMDGFSSFPEPIAADKVRGKAEKFADHYSQATLFWNSQTQYEKDHIVRGFRFELPKVQVPAIRERTVSMLRNVDEELAQAVADGLGIPLPEPMPRVFEPSAPEVVVSPTLSLTARPGAGDIRGRRVAIL